MGEGDVFERSARTLSGVRDAVRTVILGQDALLDGVLLCIASGGHGLLEGAPGLGKTLLVRAFAAALGLRFSRIQFTPDLLPADVTGTQIVTEDPQGRRRFELVKGPVFGQLVLADEINRATPRTQSALLEAMAETQVTIAGERHAIEPPFTVLATQNPLEMEGTYPLPEAQLDRFLLKLFVARPEPSHMVQILAQTTAAPVAMPGAVTDAAALIDARAVCRDVAVATPLLERVALLLRALDPHDAKEASPLVRRSLRFGPGVRGGQSMVLAAKASALLRGAANVSLEDLRGVAVSALEHRMALSFDGEAEGVSLGNVLNEALDAKLDGAKA